MSASSHIKAIDINRTWEHLRDKSFALLSTAEEADTVAVFVHGFWSDPTKAWGNFEEFIDGRAFWARTDLFFVSYGSVTDEISLSANYISDFLAKLLPSAPRALLEEDGFAVRRASGTYRKVRFFGHSLGGLIIRLSVLDLLKKGGAIESVEAYAQSSAVGVCDLIRDADITLFAPAICGARPGGSLKGFFLDALRKFGDGVSPALQELERGSHLVSAIRADTDYLAENHPRTNCLRANIAWAQNDGIVTGYPYRYDLSHRMLRVDHSEVCKPTTDFLVPLEFMETGKPLPGSAWI